MGTLPRILVVDDGEEIREFYELMLRRAGYEVRTASDGKSGFEQVRTWRPDLIVLDVVMPVMDGLEMLLKMRSELKPPIPPVILNSGFDLTESEALRRGALRFLHKPTEGADLLGAVADALHGRPTPPAAARNQRLRSSVAREHALESAGELVRRIEAHGGAPLQLLEKLSQAKLETVATYVGIERGVWALVRDGKLAVVASTDATALARGVDLGAVVPQAYEVLETGSSLLLPDACAQPFESLSQSLGGIRFFAGVPLRVGGIAVGVACLYDPATQTFDGDELAALEQFGRRGSDVLLRFSESGEVERLTRHGRGIVRRDMFDDLGDAELRLLDRRGGSMELAVLDFSVLSTVEATLARIRSTRMVGCVLSPTRVALFKRASDDSAGRALASVVAALGPHAVGYVDLVGAGLRGLATRDVVHLACAALDRAVAGGERVRRVVIEERSV